MGTYAKQTQNWVLENYSHLKFVDRNSKKHLMKFQESNSYLMDMLTWDLPQLLVATNKWLQWEECRQMLLSPVFVEIIYQSHMQDHHSISNNHPSIAQAILWYVLVIKLSKDHDFFSCLTMVLLLSLLNWFQELHQFKVQTEQVNV